MTTKIRSPKSDQRLDQTLRPVLQTPFVKNPAKDVENHVEGSRRDLMKRGSTLCNKGDSNLHGVRGGLTKKHLEKLQRNSLASDSLVHKYCVMH
ncbi:unnamed protein product [Thlaspi arvense]|uniref:Uncharacterized protein n=1 Tax=Thlaspi arvense TaxID=13288 RepID=A0AAU9S415_THLAR|nr:unnamed protein product [Thlaspi arvense]